MTPAQLNALRGAAQLELAVDELLRTCGLPTAISDRGPDGRVPRTRHRIAWGDTAMRLAATDWRVTYGLRGPGLTSADGWVNPAGAGSGCLADLSQVHFDAKGHVGVLTVTKKPDGIGYVTTYRVPDDLFKSHKVVAVTSLLGAGLAQAALLTRYGAPDEVLPLPGGRRALRYWVATVRDRRPERLYAVDFEVDKGVAASYQIRTSGVEIVQQRLDGLLRKWEREHVLD